jgi:polysaccharide biosynthesis transport protein
MGNFVKLLRRYWWLLILAPVLSSVVAYFAVKRMPGQYKSHSRIATGIVDRNDEFLRTEDNQQESQVSQQFSNLIQLITIRKIVNQVSYQLIIHDLTDAHPYQQPSKLIQELNPSAKAHAVEVFRQKFAKMEELSLWNADEKGLDRLLRSMKYDYESVLKNLQVFRAGNSDFIDLDYTGRDPQQTAFVVNTLTDEFIRYYSTVVKENQGKAVNFLDSLLRQKATAMNSKKDELKNYKIRNKVLNLNEQAKSLYAQIADMETRREVEQKNIASYSAALKEIDNRFNPNDRKYLESSLTGINQAIGVTREELKRLNNEYVKNGFDAGTKRQIDSLQNVLTNQINQSSDKYLLNPLASKQNLVNQKLNMEISLDLAKNSVASIDQEISRLNSKITNLVPNEAVIQGYESDIDISGREYLEILKKFNQTSMESNYAVKLRQVEVGMPGEPEPSKKLLLVAIAGIAALVLVIVILFVSWYLDDSIKVPEELAERTGLPVLGILPKSGGDIDFHDIWGKHEALNGQQLLKNESRSLRYEIIQGLQGSKVLGVTSVNPGEGKTFAAVDLAYAFAALNKSVLLIDGNFEHPGISVSLKPKEHIENVIAKDISVIVTEWVPTVLGNKGGDYSLLELGEATIVEKKINDFKEQFDYIIIEVASLKNMERSKEWLTYIDKVIAVFKANTSIHQNDKVYIEYLRSLDRQFIGWIFNKAEAAPIAKKGNKKIFSHERVA